MLAALIGMTMLWGASAAADEASSAETLERVEQKIVAAWNHHQSVHVSVHSLVNTPGANRSIEVTGTMDVLRRDDALDLVRTDSTMKTTLGSGDKSASTYRNTLENYDGESAYHLVNIGDDRRLFKVDPLRVQRIAGRDLLVQLRADHQLKLLEAERIGDRGVFVIEATPNRSSPVDKLHVYVDQEHGVAVKFTLYDHDGAELRTVNLFDLQFDKKMSPELFHFAMPSDLRVIDQTTAGKDNPGKRKDDKADVNASTNGDAEPQPTPAP